MGVKSTVTLTRDQAIEKFAELQARMDLTDTTVFGRFMAGRLYATHLPDEVLEEALERMNDEAAGGEGFENYIIDEER